MVSLSTTKIVALSTIFVVIMNMFLFAFRLYSVTIFWIIIIIAAIIAFPVMKWLNKKSGRR